MQISDVHIGSRRSGFLKRIAARITAEHPSAVFITGDLVDARGISIDELAPLGQLGAPTYFTTGNHERYEDHEDILERLSALGIRVLRNESVDAHPFQLVGIDDADAYDTVKNALAGIEPIPDRTRVLLYHRPNGAEDASAWGADVMLTGHTHHGQIYPFNFLVKRMFPRTKGSHDVGGMLLHVCPGTGTWGPFLRLGSRCEITSLRFI